MLENLEPKPVWKYFEQFCAIPHPSGHEHDAATYVLNLASKLGLTAISDNVGNVLIRKKGIGPSANRSTVILQSHLDMVPQKNAATTHDFTKDPIRPFIDGEWVKARGTTLGADNGIGVAITCAVLESTAIRHGPIEALFTVDEERGMTGAFGLAEDFLTGRTLINLDTENEDEICIGCAGGTDIIATLPAHYAVVEDNRTALSIIISGLRGGHSGMEIHLGRGNALKLMARLLAGLAGTFDLQITTLHGGSARNAIPREAFATVTVPKRQSAGFAAAVAAVGKDVARELSGTDPGFRIAVSEISLPPSVIDPAGRKRLLTALTECPSGVLRMSEKMPGVVETSNNLAIVTAGRDTFRIDCMLRSSSEQDLNDLQKRVSGLFSDCEARVAVGGHFPGWQPVPDSALLAAMKEVYQTIHKKAPKIVAVHAGLECGIIGARFPGMEMISCGPTIRCAHSPDEQMHIPSVERFWRCLVAGLERV
ncbi:MAG: aminoacyl-histidine dipeptidase [Chitinispirillaceae bacterium]|nr:aminoacyl-histidine dipeptidase [Chitinispirillaceae bacterium]